MTRWIPFQKRLIAFFNAFSPANPRSLCFSLHVPLRIDRPEGGLKTQSPHTQYIHSQFVLASLASSPRSLALARASLQSSPVPSSFRCTLATSPAARFVRLACRLASLTASPAALASLAASPAAARFARRFACGCSFRSQSHLLARLTRLARLADPAFHRYPLAEVSVTEKLALLPTVTLGGTYCRILAKSYG